MIFKTQNNVYYCYSCIMYVVNTNDSHGEVTVIECIGYKYWSLQQKLWGHRWKTSACLPEIPNQDFYFLLLITHRDRTSEFVRRLIQANISEEYAWLLVFSNKNSKITSSLIIANTSQLCQPQYPFLRVTFCNPS